MKLQYSHYKQTIKSEYAKYKASVEAANAAIRKCPGRTVTKTTSKPRAPKPAPPKPPSINKKPVFYNGRKWDYDYYYRYMRSCQGKGMCKYACGAKFNLLREKDKYKMYASRYRHYLK